MDNVNLQKYSGVWYEIARKPLQQQNNLYCNVGYYEFVDHNKLIVIHKAKKGSMDGEKVEVKGIAWPTDNTHGKLKL